MGEDPKTLANEIERLENFIIEREAKLNSEYPEVLKQIKSIEVDKGRVKSLKDDLKALLVERDDLDTYETDSHKFSVSKIVKLEAENIDLVPAEFKAVKEVADEKKAQDYYKLMGVAPEGFKDKSYHRLNWKEF